MNHRFSNVFLSLIISIVLSSCKDCPCIRANLSFGLVGFTEPEIDTIILRKFGKNSNFGLQKDTIPFYNLNFGRFTDTMLFSYYPNDAYLVSNYDYDIFFPGAGKLFRISEINEINSEQRCNGPLAREKVDCVNEIISYKLNGQITQPALFQKIYLDR